MHFPNFDLNVLPSNPQISYWTDESNCFTIFIITIQNKSAFTTSKKSSFTTTLNKCLKVNCLTEPFIYIFSEINYIWSGSMLFAISFFTCYRVCKRTAWILIRLRGCAGWSGSMLVANPLCWFCRDAAHFITYFNWYYRKEISANKDHLSFKTIHVFSFSFS
jgi:hypothetical protein